MILTLELSQLHLTNTENIKCTLLETYITQQSGAISEKSYSTLIIYGSFGSRMVFEGPIDTYPQVERASERARESKSQEASKPADYKYRSVAVL